MKNIFFFIVSFYSSIICGQNAHQKFVQKLRPLANDSERLSAFNMLLGGDTRNSGELNLGVGGLWSRAWLVHSNTASLLGGFNFKKKIATIEVEYNYSHLPIIFPSFGLNLNSSFNNQGATFGIKPMIGWDFIMGNLNFGYNIITNKNNDLNISNQFSFSLYLRLNLIIDVLNSD